MHQQPDIHMPKGAKSYTALITQTSTNAPTVIVLSNTIGNIIWTRDDVGVYTGTLTGAFPQNKTAVSLSNTYSGNAGYAAYRNDDNSIGINTCNQGSDQVFANADGILDHNYIQIITH